MRLGLDVTVEIIRHVEYPVIRFVVVIGQRCVWIGHIRHRIANAKVCMSLGGLTGVVGPEELVRLGRGRHRHRAETDPVERVLHVAA